MRQFLTRFLRTLFGPPGDDLSRSGETMTEAQELQNKIRKWERQAEEYEAMGLTELARRSRESIRGYRFKLKTLQDPTFRRAA